jgi:hypothetical protein
MSAPPFVLEHREEELTSPKTPLKKTFSWE